MNDSGNFLIFAVFVVVVLAIPVVVIFSMFRGFSSKGAYALEVLKHGETCHARVVKAGRKGLSGSRQISYEFTVDGRAYGGRTNHASLALGDFIEISYLPQDPTKNFPTEIIESAKAKLPADFFDE